MRDNTICTILEKKIIAVLRGYDADTALHIIEALCKGGIRLVEFPFDQNRPETWNKTAETIRRFAAGDMLVGAGTVTSPELVDIAAEAGASFIVSPNTNEAVIDRTHKRDLVAIPGAMTPTEILSAHNAGADFVKLFPAGCLGASYLKTICQPIDHVRILAFGGIDDVNVADYLNAGAVGAGIGSCLVKKEWVKNGDFSKTAEAAQRLLKRIEY